MIRLRLPLATFALLLTASPLQAEFTVVGDWSQGPAGVREFDPAQGSKIRIEKPQGLVLKLQNGFEQVYKSVAGEENVYVFDATLDPKGVVFYKNDNQSNRIVFKSDNLGTVSYFGITFYLRRIGSPPKPTPPPHQTNDSSAVARTISFDSERIAKKNLGKSAGRGRPDERHLQPVAPLAPKASGGAYIQWATADGWGRGYEEERNGRILASIASNVYVTEVDGNGNVVGEDILLGRSQPGGIVATDDGFAYYLKDHHKLTFGRYTGRQKTGEVVLMDHKDFGSRDVTAFRRGIDLRTKNGGEFPFGWAVPYAPFSRGHGGLAFGNNRVGTTFAIWNNYQPSANPPPGGWKNPNDAHTGSTAWFFGGNPARDYKMSYSTGDHSLDQRMIFDSGVFYSVSLNPHIVFRRFDSQENVAKQTVLFDEPTDYSQPDGSLVTDNGAMEFLKDGTRQSKTSFLEARGYTLGRLGDLHALGGGRFALTYGYASWADNENFDLARARSAKNQVDVAILDVDGNVITRRIVAKPDSRAGRDGFNEYFPYERVKWVKSAMSDGRLLIFWATERRGSRDQPTYVAVVDRDGNLLQKPQPVPASAARFNFNDRLHTLSNGAIAWTYTGAGELQLYTLTP